MTIRLQPILSKNNMGLKWYSIDQTMHPLQSTHLKSTMLYQRILILLDFGARRRTVARQFP